MIKQILFSLSVIITLAVFTYTTIKYVRLFKLTKSYPIKDWGKRFVMMLKVAIGQSKIFRFPFIGLLHALVFWGLMM